MLEIIETQIKNLPAGPGVYILKDKHEVVLYIGKAKNLKKRVLSHFSRPADLFKEKMIRQVVEVDFIKTRNENKALILEEQLIKKFQPKFNIDWKDDKSYFWVAISEEKYPRFSIVHKQSTLNHKRLTKIGPFVNSRELKSLMRQIRKIIPYRTCRVLPQKTCLQYDLGNCPGWCHPKHKTPWRALTKANYAKASVKLISEFLKIYQGKSGRLEAYDISNIQGGAATGSMVVFKNNKPQKKDYRLFKIKTVARSNDPKMQAEIIGRRLNHKEWPWPNLILLDGGKGQISVVGKILERAGIPFLGLAKKEETLYSPYSKNSIKLSFLPKEISDTLMYARDEAHRFAISYHRKLRRKSLV